MFHDEVKHTPGHEPVVDDIQFEDIKLRLDDPRDYTIHQLNNIVQAFAHILEASEATFAMKRKMSQKDRLAYFYKRIGARDKKDVENFKSIVNRLVGEIRCHLFAGRAIDPYRVSKKKEEG